MEYDRGDDKSLLRLSYKRRCSFYHGYSLSRVSLGLGETNCLIVSSPVGRPMWPRTEASCQLEPRWHWGLQKTAPWMNLEMHAGNCSLRDILSARTGPRRYSCLPDSVKIINICCFKMLSLGTIFMQQQITKTISFRKRKKERKKTWRQGHRTGGEGMAGDQARKGTGQVTWDFFGITWGVWTESWG